MKQEMHPARSTEYRRSFFKRLKNFLSVFLTSKMAVIGIILLLAFAGVAVAAPLITPYDQEGGSGGRPVAAAFASPQWQTYFPDSRLSINTEVFDDPSFIRESSALEWSSQSPAQGVSLSYDSQVTAPNSPGGSLGLGYSRPSLPGANVSVIVEKTFNFPYRAPPGAFSGTVLVRVRGATFEEPILVRMFTGRVGGNNFTLARFNFTADTPETLWKGPDLIIDSNLSAFKEKVLELGGTLLNAATVVFPTPGTYVVGFEVGFTDKGLAPTKSVSLNFDDVSLKLLGNAFGLLGTDGGGRDLFAQLVYGARVSLIVGLVASALGIGIGLIVGLLSGYVGKVLDEALMRLNDMMLVIPTFPLLFVLISVLGPGLINLIIVLGLLGWNGFARVVRSQVLSVRERPFIEAARASGAGTTHIIGRHVLPNVVGLTYVNLALSVPNAILSEAALSFLGLFDPAVNSWGRVLYNAQVQGGIFQWWWVVPPGLAIAAVSLSFILMGYALDDIFNPKLRKRR